VILIIFVTFFKYFSNHYLYKISKIFIENQRYQKFLFVKSYFSVIIVLAGVIRIFGFILYCRNQKF